MDLQLVPYYRANPVADAPRLVAAVDCEVTLSRLRVDFPHVPERYASVPAAWSAIGRVADSMVEGTGLGAYLVVMDGVMCGVVSFRMDRSTRGLLFKRVLAYGPLIAGWLKAKRLAQHRGVLPALLKEGARELALRRTADVNLTGHPWTVVRPEHKVVIAALTEANNGFGGFAAVGEPRVYNPGDGITVPRQLYVAKLSVAELQA